MEFARFPSAAQLRTTRRRATGPAPLPAAVDPGSTPRMWTPFRRGISRCNTVPELQSTMTVTTNSLSSIFTNSTYYPIHLFRRYRATARFWHIAIISSLHYNPTHQLGQPTSHSFEHIAFPYAPLQIMPTCKDTDVDLIQPSKKPRIRHLHDARVRSSSFGLSHLTVGRTPRIFMASTLSLFETSW